MFKKAEKKKQKLRLLIEGASGSGKTYSALKLAKGLAEKTGAKIALIDTEKGSASLYDNLVDFDVCELEPPFTPEKYIKAIQEAKEAGYGILIIDSITHEWSGKGGCLDIQMKLGGRFNDWAQVTPRHQAFIDAIVQAPMHIISTARTKTDYALEDGTNKSGGKTTKPVKIGLKTEQREGMDYEFTIVFRVNENHYAEANKDRTSLFNGIAEPITEETGYKLFDWLNSGAEPVKQPEPPENKKIDLFPDAGNMPAPDQSAQPDDMADIDLIEGLNACESIAELKDYYEQNRAAAKNKQAFAVAKDKRKVEILQKFKEDVTK